MPDNAAVNTGAGLSVATDEILSALTGTVSKSNGSPTVTGSGTAFQSELSVGMVISIPGTAAERGIITAIASDTSLTVAANFANTASGQTASRVLHYQLIKLVLGAMDANDGPVANGNPLPVVGSSITVTPTHTVDTAVYAAGDTVGGIITIVNAFRASGKEAILQSIHILDRSNQKPTGNLLFFNASPSAATTTDNAAFVYSTDDLKEVARVQITAADYATINSKATANLSNLGRQVYATTGTSLFVVFVTDGAPDFVNTTDLQISYSFLRD